MAHLPDCRAALIERRRASRRGRPRGSTVPLLRDPHRFETAAWLTATLGLGFGPHVAAGAVAGVFSPRPLRAEMVGELVMRLSTGVAHASLKGRADRIRRRADSAIRQRTDEEEAWLVASSGALLQLATSEGDPAGIAYAIDQLDGLGWTPTLSLVARRLREAFRSNLPPMDEPISRRVRQLIEALTIEGKPAQ